MDKFNVDSGARRVFLGLRPDQQEALRRMGGLGQSHPSGMLMLRIRRSFGYVDLDTLMASDDLDQRSRSPALRIPSTEMNEIQGKGSLGNVISGPQPLHASTASLGAPEHTQTGVTAFVRWFGVSGKPFRDVSGLFPVIRAAVARKRPGDVRGLGFGFLERIFPRKFLIFQVGLTI